MARINSVGGRPENRFPLGLDLSGIDFRNSRIDISIPDVYPVGINWAHANLSGANVRGSCFYDQEFTKVLAKDLQAWSAVFELSDFTGADLCGAQLLNASFEKSNLSEANISKAMAGGANFSKANLTNTNIIEVDWLAAIVEGATGLKNKPEDTYLSFPRFPEFGRG